MIVIRIPDAASDYRPMQQRRSFAASTRTPLPLALGGLDLAVRELPAGSGAVELVLVDRDDADAWRAIAVDRKEHVRARAAAIALDLDRGGRDHVALVRAGAGHAIRAAFPAAGDDVGTPPPDADRDSGIPHGIVGEERGIVFERALVSELRETVDHVADVELIGHPLKLVFESHRVPPGSCDEIVLRRCPAVASEALPWRATPPPPDTPRKLLYRSGGLRRR